MQRRFFGLLVAATTALAVAACGSSGSASGGSSTAAGSSTTGAQSSTSSTAGASSKPFTVLFIGDLSGVTEIYGKAQLVGLKAAAAYLNDTRGGIDGHPVQITASDNGGLPTTAVTDLLKYVSSNGNPDAVYAGAEANSTAALLPVLAKRHLYGFAATDGNGVLSAAGAASKYPLQFDMGASFPAIVTAAADWFKSKNIGKVGILEESIDYALGETPYLTKALKSAGISYAIASFPATATDLTPEVSELRSAGVQGIYSQALGPAAGYALRARAKLAWDVPILGDLAFGAGDLPALAPAAELKNLEFPVSLSVPADSPIKGVKLMTTYMAKTGGTNPQGATYSSISEAWDGLVATADAADQAKSVSPQAIASALENLKVTADPAYASQHEIGFTPTQHTNVLLKASDFPIVTPGPIVNGQLHSKTY